jgi:prevent-host-death family protein
MAVYLLYCYKGDPKMTAMAINEARDKLTHIIRYAEQGESALLTRHGKPVAVLMGYREYEDLHGDAGLARALDDFMTQLQADSEPGSGGEFDNLRSREPGRELTL